MKWRERVLSAKDEEKNQMEVERLYLDLHSGYIDIMRVYKYLALTMGNQVSGYRWFELWSLNSNIR